MVVAEVGKLAVLVYKRVQETGCKQVQGRVCKQVLVRGYKRVEKPVCKLVQAKVGKQAEPVNKQV